MSQSSAQSRKRGHASSSSKSSGTGKTRTTTPYSGEFEQKLIDQRVFPDGHRKTDGCRPPKRNNVKEIMDALSRLRSSLSPSAFSGDAFEDFQDNNRRARSESNAMADLLLVIVGPQDKQYNTTGDLPFNRLKKFDPDISVPKPDRYYGARPAQIEARVRCELDEYIIPSNRTSLPAAPNFFLEGKSASGRPDVAQRQAMYDGAVGARGMLHLQNYGNANTAYDGNAYTISSTYHPGTGTLQMYATHPRQSAIGETEYYMTQLRAYAMTDTSESFCNGAAAYRNAREWTQQQRDHFIDNANAAASRVTIESVSPNQTESMTGTPSTAAMRPCSSETSADELAVDHDIAAKRRRPATK